MKCPNCGEELKEKTKFCTKCGTNLEEANKKEDKKLKEEKSNTKNESKKTDESKPKEKSKKTEEVTKEKEKKESKTDKKTKEEKKIANQEQNKEQEKEIKKEKKQDKNEEKESDKDDKKVEDKSETAKTKKTNKKATKIIIAILLIIVIAAGAIIGTMLYMSDKESSDEEKEKNLEWGDIYLEILNDDSKIENMEEMKIGLIDLDQDGIPELIVKGINAAKERLASIYKVNDQNKVDTINVMMDKDFELKLVYDLAVDKYVWYAVANENSETPEVYDLNIETKKYEKELLDRNFKQDIFIVDTASSKMVDFSKELSKNERKEKFNEAKDGYVTTESMITDEIKEKVELARAIRNIEKLDPSREIVYSVVSKKINGNTYEYPCININSADVRNMNSKIEEEYGLPENLNENNFPNYVFIENEERSYKYTINENILSLIIWEGGNESIWASTYNVDLKTAKELKSEEILKKYNLNKDDVISKATEAVKKESNNLIDKEKKSLGDMWGTMGYESCLSGWTKETEDYIKELHLYVNEKNEVCILGKYAHAGGQWSCTQTVLVNITKDYSVTELGFKDGKTFTHSIASTKIEQPKETSKPSSTPQNTPSNQTTPTTSTPTESGISQEEALQKLKTAFGADNQYIYEGWAKDENGKQYYIYDIKWKVDDGGGASHYSWIGAAGVAVDGRNYRQLDTPQYTLENGSTLTNMYDAESF